MSNENKPTKEELLQYVEKILEAKEGETIILIASTGQNDSGQNALVGGTGGDLVKEMAIMGARDNHFKHALVKAANYLKSGHFQKLSKAFADSRMNVPFSYTAEA